MRHQNTVFHQVQQFIPWGEFERLVTAHQADHRVRRCPTKVRFVAMLFGQLAGAASLRHVVDSLQSQSARLYHIGGRPVAKSTLADANAVRPSEVFSELFSAMVAQAQRGLRRRIGEATYLIDATGLRLSGLGSEWARFSAKACGAKLHVVYDADAERPIYAAVTPAKTPDIKVAQTMPIEAGATYVFDLGYYDFRWWTRMDAAGCRIVTRFRSSTPLRVTAELQVPEDSAILSDRIGLLPEWRNRSRKNPFSDPVREVCVRHENGKVLRILCNDLDADAQEIADLYKRRWMIELFFRWVKQTLKIRHFFGKSENAIRIQIAVALIAYLLISLARAAINLSIAPLAIARLIRLNLMERRDLRQLNRPQQPPPNRSGQLDLALRLT